VTGAGRGFSSGGDITFMQSVMEKGGRWEDFRALVDAGRDLLVALSEIDKPVIRAGRPRIPLNTIFNLAGTVTCARPR